MALPHKVDRHLGRQALEVLDHLVFEPSQLAAATRERLTRRFDELATATQSKGAMRLVFRASPTIGANAFALPSGTVVMTDELVQLAAHEDEAVAVLAHELGHVQARHTLRSVLQSSATVVLFAVMTGDLASLSSLSATLPTFLLQMKYSRAFELELTTMRLQCCRVLASHPTVSPRFSSDWNSPPRVGKMSLLRAKMSCSTTCRPTPRPMSAFNA